MIICPNCKHQEVDGAIFCSDCGAQLVQRERTSTQKIDGGELNAEARRTAPILDNSDAFRGNTWLSLHLLESGQILPLSDKTEFTIGRVSANQPIMPDIDLTPYNAYENGVSRIHAVIRINQGTVELMDLGSSNGTFLNSERLSPNAEKPIRHGDIISLGKLRIQIVMT